MVSEGAPGGISKCPSRPTGYIKTFFFKSVLLKNERLHFSENVQLLLIYPNGCSICVVKMFYFENLIYVNLGSSNFPSHHAPVSPYRHNDTDRGAAISRNINLIGRDHKDTRINC